LDLSILQVSVLPSHLRFPHPSGLPVSPKFVLNGRPSRPAAKTRIDPSSRCPRANPSPFPRRFLSPHASRVGVFIRPATVSSFFSLPKVIEEISVPPLSPSSSLCVPQVVLNARPLKRTSPRLARIRHHKLPAPTFTHPLPRTRSSSSTIHGIFFFRQTEVVFGTFTTRPERSPPGASPVLRPLRVESRYRYSRSLR